MSEALDKLRREILELRRVINAQQSGLPSHLGVIVHSDDPVVTKAAVSARLAPFGLFTLDEAKEAGCEVSVLCLPWCEGRAVDKTDPADADALRVAGKGPASVGASVGNAIAHDETHINIDTHTYAALVCVPSEGK